MSIDLAGVPGDPVNDNENEKFLVNSFPSTAMRISTVPDSEIRDVVALKVIEQFDVPFPSIVAFNPAYPVGTSDWSPLIVVLPNLAIVAFVLEVFLYAKIFVVVELA